MFIALEPVEIALYLGIPGMVAVTWLLIEYISNYLQVRERENTRREVAAYVAEGSISPDDAERILTAGNKTALAEGVDEVVDGVERVVAAVRSEGSA